MIAQPYVQTQGSRTVNGRMFRPKGVDICDPLRGYSAILFQGRTDGGRWEITTSEAGVAPASVLARP